MAGGYCRAPWRWGGVPPPLLMHPWGEGGDPTGHECGGEGDHRAVSHDISILKVNRCQCQFNIKPGVVSDGS